jgi:O-acetyl-ADP-ribose deacetylase (regulator of RNase III)
VIHAVGPRWSGGAHGEPERLASCYRRSLELAAEHGARTVAFPAISCGAYGFPLGRAARIAIREVEDHLRRASAIEKVYLVCFGEDVARAYRQAYEEARRG